MDGASNILGMGAGIGWEQAWMVGHIAVVPDMSPTG